jgi:hypothetical protein
MSNLSFSGTNRNVTSQIYETHPTLEQHRTHIKKKYFKLFIKRSPKSIWIRNSNYIHEKMCFDMKNECIKKKFQ